MVKDGDKQKEKVIDNIKKVDKDYEDLKLFLTTHLPYSRQDLIKMNYPTFFSMIDKAHKIIKAQKKSSKKASKKTRPSK